MPIIPGRELGFPNRCSTIPARRGAGRGGEKDDFQTAHAEVEKLRVRFSTNVSKKKKKQHIKRLKKAGRSTSVWMWDFWDFSSHCFDRPPSEGAPTRKVGGHVLRGKVKATPTDVTRPCVTAEITLHETDPSFPPTRSKNASTELTFDPGRRFARPPRRAATAAPRPQCCHPRLPPLRHLAEAAKENLLDFPWRAKKKKPMLVPVGVFPFSLLIHLREQKRVSSIIVPSPGTADRKREVGGKVCRRIRTKARSSAENYGKIERSLDRNFRKFPGDERATSGRSAIAEAISRRSPANRER